MLGIGAYASANRAACERARPLLWLAQDNYQAALGMRAARSESYGLLRPDDGDDAAAVEWYGDLARSVAAWLARLDSRLAQVPPRTYNAVCGPNEYMPGRGEKDKLRWRSDFEARLCRAVGDRGLDYVALNCSVGHLDAEDVETFAPVFRSARWVSYHGYTSPWLVGPDGAGTEFVSEYFWRPLDIWLPQLRRLGIPLRLMLTEIGTYVDWRSAGLRDAQPIAYCRELDGRLAARCRVEGVGYAGAIPFGVGTVGSNAAWNLQGYESQIVNPNDTFPTVGVIHSQPPPVGGKPVTDYIKATWVGSPNFGYPTGAHGRRGHLPVMIVDHMAEGYAVGVDATFLAPNGVAAHYLVCRDGSVRQYVREADAAWAVGIVNNPDMTNPFVADAMAHGTSPNEITISIEHEGFARTALTEPQYQATFALHLDIVKRWSLPVDDTRIVGHNTWDSVNRAGDPGIAFPWGRLRFNLQAALKPAPAVDAVTDALNGIWDVSLKLAAKGETASAVLVQQKVVALKVALGRQ